MKANRTYTRCGRCGHFCSYHHNGICRQDLCECSFGGRITVTRARHQNSRGRYNWVVRDYRGPKVFIREFSFSYWSAAMREANRLARTGLVNPQALFGVQRMEYSAVES
jgi:hypothetical protein